MPHLRVKAQILKKTYQALCNSCGPLLWFLRELFQIKFIYYTVYLKYNCVAFSIFTEWCCQHLKFENMFIIS